MRGIHAVVLIALGICGGCGGPRPASCAWPAEPAVHLDRRTSSGRRHLNADARAAEEMAIHYADVTRGHRSGQFTDYDTYYRTRDRCLESVAGEIANRHGISPVEVSGAIGQRDDRLDAIVLLVLTVIFGFAANGAARRLLARFPPDEPWPALIGMAGAAAFVSAVGVILGGLASSIVEMIQVGDTHLSYRADRLPWNHHWPPLFAGALVLFVLIAAIRWRQASGVAHLAQHEHGVR